MKSNLDNSGFHDAKRQFTQSWRRTGIMVLITVLFVFYFSKPLFSELWPTKPTPIVHDSVSCHQDSLFGLGSTKLNWNPCGVRLQCANLSVPLDYLDPKDERRAYIAITRYLAETRTNDTGTIIFNPGGPGGSGTAATYKIGPLLDKILQGKYDILGFDPRGINMTLPRVNCVRDVASRASLGQLMASTSPGINIHDIGIWDAAAQMIAEECEWNSGEDVLPYVNTPSVVRDIVSIVDALHADRKHHVSYWGFSYGTNIGSMLVGMFPNKLHKIILDGIRSVLDARDIFEWGYTSLASQTDSMKGYFEICDRVGPSRCSIAGDSQKIVMDLLKNLYDRPLPVVGDSQFGLVTYYGYKSLLYLTLYRPATWPQFAQITKELLLGNGSLALQALDQDWTTVEASAAVLCTDAVPATKYSLSNWAEFVQNMTKMSLVAGDSRSLETLPCRHWYTEPNERWTGSFDDLELETPVLLLSNSFDPATPYESAKRLHKSMGKRNSRLLLQQSYGHCSISTISTCTWNTTLGYLLDGKVPENGKVCQIDNEDQAYFPADSHSLSSNPFQELNQALSMLVRS